MIVLKYPICYGGNCSMSIQMPKRARVLAAGQQEGMLTVWAQIDGDNPYSAPTEPRMFHVIGTGMEVSWMKESPMRYIGTVFDPIGLVWHVYEETQASHH